MLLRHAWLPAKVKSQLRIVIPIFWQTDTRFVCIVPFNTNPTDYARLFFWVTLLHVNQMKTAFDVVKVPKYVTPLLAPRTPEPVKSDRQQRLSHKKRRWKISTAAFLPRHVFFRHDNCWCRRAARWQERRADNVSRSVFGDAGKRPVCSECIRTLSNFFG